MPGLRQLPGEVLGVPQPLVEALGAEGAQQVCGVPGEERAPGPPAPGQPVVQGVHTGVQQFVGRRLTAPSREGVADTGDQGVRGDEFAAWRKEPVQSPDAVGQRPGGDLRTTRTPGRRPVQHGLARPGQLGAERGDRMPFDRRTAGEPDVQQLAHGGSRTVAAHQVTPAPPGRTGPPGVHRDTVLVLLQGVDPAERHHGDQVLRGDRCPQPSGERVLGQMHGRGQRNGALLLTQRHGPHQLLTPHRPPAGPPQPLVVERRTAEPCHQVRRVLAQHDGASGAWFVAARSLVEQDGGDALGRECERQRQTYRPGADDDHRVHGVIPPVLIVEVAEAVG